MGNENVPQLSSENVPLRRGAGRGDGRRIWGSSGCGRRARTVVRAARARSGSRRRQQIIGEHPMSPAASARQTESAPDRVAGRRRFRGDRNGCRRRPGRAPPRRGPGAGIQWRFETWGTPSGSGVGTTGGPARGVRSGLPNGARRAAPARSPRSDADAGDRAAAGTSVRVDPAGLEAADLAVAGEGGFGGGQNQGPGQEEQRCSEVEEDVEVVRQVSFVRCRSSGVLLL